MSAFLMFSLNQLVVDSRICACLILFVRSIFSDSISFFSNKGLKISYVGNNNEKFQIILKGTARGRYMLLHIVYEKGKLFSIAILNYYFAL